MSTYIIAEAGINHGGDIEIARRMIEGGAQSGVNAVKFQSFTASELASKSCAPEQYEFFKRFELSDDEHRQLKEVCETEGVEFLSTPFDFEKADLLERLGVTAFKVASSDLTNLPLIRHIAKKQKRMFISTGMSEMSEVIRARDEALSRGCPEVVMLHCTTLYPTPYEHANLLAIREMQDVLGSPVGFSDHTIGNYACFAAAALGAVVIEKHFTLDKSMEGPDIPGSCDLDELRDLVSGIRAIEESLGKGVKVIDAAERKMQTIARRSVFSAVEIPEGAVIEETMLAYRRPGDGIPPTDADSVVGKRAKAKITPDTKLSWDMFE